MSEKDEIPEEPTKANPESKEPDNDDVEEGGEKPGQGLSDEVIDEQTEDITDDPSKPEK
jgi:hypothetical protein